MSIFKVVIEVLVQVRSSDAGMLVRSDFNVR